MKSQFHIQASEYIEKSVERRHKRQGAIWNFLLKNQGATSDEVFKNTGYAVGTTGIRFIRYKKENNIVRWYINETNFNAWLNNTPPEPQNKNEFYLKF